MSPIHIPAIQLSAIAPEIILTCTAALLLMMEVFAEKKGKDHLGYVALAGVALAGYATIGLHGPAHPAFSGLYVVDNFSTFFKVVFLIGTGLSILLSVKYIKDEGIDSGEYYAMLLFATVGMFTLASAANLITVFMGVEVLSISLYVLAGYTRARETSNEASIKYFILGALSSGFLLYGIALVYGATGTTGLHAIGDAVRAGVGNKMTLTVGAALITLGFCFKVAAAPFHMWTPDVYQGAPSPVTAFMSAGPKAAAFAAFLRVFAEAFPGLKGEWWEIIWILAAVTMTLGNVVALQQNNVKRMLAYSSISHAGYVLVGFAAGSPAASSSILFYMLAYTFMNIAAFAIVTGIGGKGEEKVYFQDYTGLGYSRPAVGLALSVALFSLAGIPPTAGFAGKFYVFLSAIDEGFIWLAVIGVLNSVVSVFYYLRLTVYMYMREEGKAEATPAFAPSLVVATAVAVTGALWLGIAPGPYIEMAKAAFLTFQ
ncbi:MAG: NADH-quinone oxidoreductase subunit N [Nitrospinae bacterium]|nr:NADH-quinone oxidoreductase subunit N [Nitrospinota bacterium]